MRSQSRPHDLSLPAGCRVVVETRERGPSAAEDGHAVLADWRATEPGFPLIDAEPILRLVFADVDQLADLRNSVQAFRDQTIERGAFQRSMADEYRDRKGPFQDRQPIVALGGLFVASLHETYLRWCDDALAALDAWERGESARADWGESGVIRLADLLDRALGNEDP